MDETRPRLILLCGLPGSGKTTFACQLEAQVGAVRFGADEWMAELEVDLHDEAFRDRLERRLWRLAQDLLQNRQSVILEFGFWIRDERDEKRRKAHDLGTVVDIYYFNVPLEELWSRILCRNAAAQHGAVPITRSQLEEYATVFQAPTRHELEAFDSFQIFTGFES